MITKDIFRELLKKLGFKTDINLLSSSIYKSGEFSVDFEKEILNYPKEIKIHGEFTRSFSQNENFVVFEAVFRLVEKGYRPEHIELEKKWQLGRGASGGRADILVNDENSRPLLIIECKTWGVEFEKEQKKMFEKGGQLFSYWQQERDTKFLILYASDFQNSKLIYENLIIKTADSEERIEEADEFDFIKLYKKSGNVKALFDAWSETYNKHFYMNGIFEKDIEAYNIDLKPLKFTNLKSFSRVDSGYIHNQIEEILRHNAISDIGGAYNTVLNLLICKVADEKFREDSAEPLDFQWKEGVDDFESFVDRLRKLYFNGTKKYLDSTHKYKSLDEIKEMVYKFPTHTTQEDILEEFKNEKFYSCNQFSFAEVESKEDFEENSKVLKEVVELFQNYRFLYSSKNDVLGSFFELLLEDGFKQKAGQFFTPIPVASFILKSLPLEEFKEVPKVIDYASGSGHFLIEAVNEIQKSFNTSSCRNYIFGIEKDKRLSKTSKLSTLLNGYESAKIIKDDGLYKHDDLLEDSFNILVANPPYSVKEFKGALNKKRLAEYELFDALNLNSSEIEALFIERIAHYLKTGGLAGVILPSSILSNSGVYSRARAFLLQNFYIRAIVELGSSTFIATGTNTVTLFLEKRDNKEFKNSRYIANDLILNNIKRENDFENSQESLEEFKAFRGDWESNFKEFKSNFKISKDLERLPEEKREKIVREKFLELETDKFIYYRLTKDQKVLIVKSGEKKIEKEFLGYEFSKRRGNEGLKKYLDKDGKFATKLYDDENLENSEKTNFYIREAFRGKTDLEVPETLKNHISYLNLLDMLDFSKNEFNKSISTTAKRKMEIETKWDLVKLGEVCDIKIGGTPSRGKQEYFNGNALWVSISEMVGETITNTKEKITKEAIKNSNVKLIPKGTALLSFKLSIGKTAIAGKDLYTNEAIAGLIPIELQNREKLLDKYLFYIFNSKYIPLEKNGFNTFGKSLNSKFLRESVKIPLPPINIQEKIVSEIDVIDDEVEKAKKLISKSKSEVEDIISSIDGEMVKLEKIVVTNPSRSEIKDIDENLAVSFVEMASVSNYGFIRTKTDRKLRDLKKGGFTYFKEKDILIAKITPSMENGKCAIAEELTNKLGFGSSEFHTFRCSKNIYYRYLFAFLNRKDIRVEAQKVMTGASGHRRVPIKFYENLQIPLPPLETQKEIVSQIELIEKEIEQANSIIETSSEKKSKILEKYLK